MSCSSRSQRGRSISAAPAPGVLCLGLFLSLGLSAEDLDAPWVDRFEPFGGQVGETVRVILVGKNLEAPRRVVFGSPHLRWEPLEATSDGEISGRILIGDKARLGPHIATLITARGRSNSRLFYVDCFESTSEVEPNDSISQAQELVLEPQTVQGMMPEVSDIDYFAFEARVGQRWTFEVRSLEYGGFLENDLTLLDSVGQQVAFNDDRDDYLETPFLEHKFAKGGRFYLKLDQYRGPQRVDCDRNCGYMLRISRLPVVEAALPLGGRIGSTVEVSLRGRALDSIEQVYLTPVRGAEYYRLTFPYTYPVRVDDDLDSRLDAEIIRQGETEFGVRFEIPPDARQGLWRIWTGGPHGLDDRISFEIADRPEAVSTDVTFDGESVSLNGSLDHEGEEDSFMLAVPAGRPIVVTSLAAQMGLPYLDTVLELLDVDGKLVAEHDDLMSGQGTVIGNLDSLLHYIPKEAGRYRLVVRDRIGRGGSSFVYRLRVEQRFPGFSLLSDPENLNLRAGAVGRVGVLLIRDPGFDHAVEVWAKGLPAGITASRGRFRADQFFGPSGDGDNVIIPEVFLRVTVSEEVAAGDYPIRVMGRASGRKEVVEAISTLWIGAPAKRNDIRRPLPSILLTVLASSGSPGPGVDLE